MRLIDADIMEKFIEEQAKDETDWLTNQYNLDWIYSFIETQPTIEAEPIKHGHWIEEENWYECSICGSGSYFIKDNNLPEIFNALPNYCENCGAKMDEVIDNG